MANNSLITSFVVGLYGKDANHLRRQIVGQEFQAKVVFERVGISCRCSKSQLQQIFQPARHNIINILDQL